MKSGLPILLLYKHSALSTAGKIGRTADEPAFRRNHVAHYGALASVESDLRGLGLKYLKRPRGSSIDYRAFRLIITVGGDGTLLEAARNVGPAQLILGVNSDPGWSIGQFCHATAGSFERLMRGLLAKKLGTRRLYKLRIILTAGKRRRVLECLNDVLICHANPAAMSRYCVAVGGVSEEHRSSGLWIASAAGSTGAILSAGGRRLPETARSVQYRARELYRLKGVRYRLCGGVLAPSKQITISSRMSDGCLFIDGSHLQYPFGLGQKAVVFHSANFINLVHV